MALRARLLATLQVALPAHAITAVTHRLARSRQPLIRLALLRTFLSMHPVDMTDAAIEDPESYPTFNDFFTRALRSGTRPLHGGADTVVSPCDGIVSAIGTLDGARILQAELSAKRHTYSLKALMAGGDLAAPFVGGRFACLYLAPPDYHRVHMPLAGTLTAVRYVPGRLFSVNEESVRRTPDLFSRNERVISVFATAIGPMAVIMVGAMNVGSISLVWAGDVTPRRTRELTALPLPATPVRLARGDELGHFNMGSTVIVLLPPNTGAWRSELAAGQRLKVGQALGRAAR
jgi:phosphatidylserine decarboxylase